MVSAQLRRDVSASIQELDRVVLKITVSVEKKGGVESICGKSWDDIELQNLLYKRRNYPD